MQLRSTIKFGLTPAACGRPPEPRGDVFECRQATTANGLTSGWRYYLGKNSTAYEVLDRQSGDKVIAAQARLNRAEDYAIISRILDVADFLTHDNYMQEAFRSAPPKWWKKNMQVVIRSSIIGGMPGPPKTVALQSGRSKQKLWLRLNLRTSALRAES